MTAPVRLSDTLLEAMAKALAAVPPERGGALLEVGGLVHLLVEDGAGTYTAVSWDISEQLGALVAELELAGHGRLVGTVHSHPAAVPDPSETDWRSTARTLDANPHLDRLLVLIVTEGAPRTGDLPLGATHRVAVHALRRAPGGHRRERPDTRIVELRRDLALAGLELPSHLELRTPVPPTERGRRPRRSDPPALVSTAVDERGMVAVVQLDGEHRLVLPTPGGRGAVALAATYPGTGPVALVGDPDDGFHVLPSPWDPTAPSPPQLRRLVAAVDGGRVEGVLDRVRPVAGTLDDAHVLVAGLGSVGSAIAEDLVRSGVRTLTLVDPDRLEASNLARTVYRVDDLGSRKTTAMARRLRAIDPGVRLTLHATALGELDLEEVLDGVDLCVGATDDMPEQRALAYRAYRQGVPVVTCALFAGAEAGEVVMVVPELATACLLCAQGGGLGAEQRPASNYGLGGRLVAEPALGPSIRLVASMASLVTVGLLAGPASRAGGPLLPLLAERRTLAIVSTTPRWGILPDVLGAAAHQHAPQSLWAVVEPDPVCTICGGAAPPAVSDEADLLAMVATAAAHDAPGGDHPSVPSACAASEGDGCG